MKTKKLFRQLLSKKVNEVTYHNKKLDDQFNWLSRSINQPTRDYKSFVQVFILFIFKIYLCPTWIGQDSKIF